MSVTAHTLASGNGWRVQDVVCTHGPDDRPFEEQHASVSIAAVTAGTFQYRTRQGRATLVPGALLLGNHGACFECGHAHAAGDRCLAFFYTPSFFESIAAEVPGARSADFAAPSRPPSIAIVPLMADATLAREENDGGAFAELALRFAGAALAAPIRMPDVTARDERRITQAVRRIESDPAATHSLGALARDAGMSPYHFLRVFRRIAGMTPHQYVLRARLMRAAEQLRRGRPPVTTVALDAGFNDLSTFIRRFRRLMGASPRAYRDRFPPL